MHKDLRLKPSNWEDLGIFLFRFSQLAKQRAQDGEHEAGPGSPSRPCKRGFGRAISSPKAPALPSVKWNLGACPDVLRWQLVFATGAGHCQVRELGKAEESLRLQRWEQELLPSAPQTGVRAVSLGLDNSGVRPG